MKKILSVTLITCMLLLPAGGTVLAVQGDTASVHTQDYLPGDATAALGPADAMLPALHGTVLAMLNHDASSFSLNNSQLAWESLYNMLSLYGQLDQRSQIQDDGLFLPDETAQDYAAALDADLNAMGSPPAALRDRMNYDNVSRCYILVCGEDDLSQIQIRNLFLQGKDIHISGALVYSVDESDLVNFQAVLQPRENMFGYALSQLTFVG